MQEMERERDIHYTEQYIIETAGHDMEMQRLRPKNRFNENAFENALHGSFVKRSQKSKNLAAACEIAY